MFIKSVILIANKMREIGRRGEKMFILKGKIKIFLFNVITKAPS